jgi:hypothetical protein
VAAVPAGLEAGQGAAGGIQAEGAPGAEAQGCWAGVSRARAKLPAATAGGPAVAKATASRVAALMTGLLARAASQS